MNVVSQLASELATIIESLRGTELNPFGPKEISLSKQLWSIVYRPYSGEERSALTKALEGELLELAQASRSLAQSLEARLELNWAERLLERKPPLSVGFHINHKEHSTPKISAFEALLHGYPLGWALPRYTAELKLLRTVAPHSKRPHVVVIGSSAIPFSAFYFSVLEGLRVTYLDPYPDSAKAGRAFIERLRAVKILGDAAAEVVNINPSAPLNIPTDVEIAFIVDQRTPYGVWMEKLRTSGVRLIFCQDAVGLARLVYQPLDLSSLPIGFSKLAETVPAHVYEPDNLSCPQIRIESTDVFLTTVALSSS